MKKAVYFILILSIMLLFKPAAVKAASSDLLLVYDTEQQNTELSALINACGKTADSVKSLEYTAGLASGYKYVITTSAAPLDDDAKAGIVTLCIGDKFNSTKTTTLTKIQNVKITVKFNGYSQPSTFENEATLITAYDGEAYGTVTTAAGDGLPFAVFASDRISVPYFKDGDLSAIMLGSVMRRYFGQNSNGNFYVLIDEIYPYSDLDMVCKTADALYENAIPFILRIMPVYDNLDYPAFKSYAQVLRYVQSRNGTIVIHSPIVESNEIEREPLSDKMSRFYSALGDQQIEWENIQYAPYGLSLGALQEITCPQKNFGVFPMDTMIVMTLPKNDQELDDTLDKLNSKWLSVSDYRHNFTDENFSYNEAPVEVQYVYNQTEKLSFESFFTAGNSFLMAVVILSLGVMAILLVFGYRIYKRKFIRRKGP